MSRTALALTAEEWRAYWPGVEADEELLTELKGQPGTLCAGDKLRVRELYAALEERGRPTSSITLSPMIGREKRAATKRKRCEEQRRRTCQEVEE